MIKVRNRPDEPNYLVLNKANLTKDLLDAHQDLKDFLVRFPKAKASMQKRSFEKLDGVKPIDAKRFEELKAVIEESAKKYKDSEVKKSVKEFSTKNKCVYCEKFVEGKEGDIEHFYPKSIYPDKCFEWTNMFWACKNCNGYQKKTHDTEKKPIVHPENDNPEDYFEYDGLGYIQASKNSAYSLKAKQTIDLFEFDTRNRGELREHRHETIYPHFRAFEAQQTELFEEYQIDRDNTKLNKLLKKLVYQKGLVPDNKIFAGYLRFLLRTSPIIHKITQEINQNKEDLGLTKDFEWSW